MPSNNPTASEHFRVEYETGVQHVFQNRGHMYGALSHKKVITGASEAEFHQFGLLTAGPKVGGVIPIQNADHKKIRVGAEEFFAPVLIDQFDLDQMGTDDRDSAKEAAGLAMARKADDIWREAIALTDTAAIGGSGTFMSPALSQEINRYFIGQYVMPYHPVYITVDPMAWSHMMRFKEFASADYNGPALPWAASGALMAKTWDGKHWLVDPALPETDTDIITAYAWTPQAMAEVQIGETRSILTWENSQNAWLANNNFRQGNKIKPALKAGILPIDIDVSILPEQIDPETYQADL
jgi:hypothetical protein